MLRIPAALRDSFAGTDEGDRWLAALPDLVAQFEDRWGVHCGDPFEGGMVSWTAPAVRTDGTAAVLKIGWPHREAREEGTALRFWNGAGAVHVYEEDRDHSALLLERCSPGTKLLDADVAAEDALSIGAELLQRLWCASPEPSSYERVADVTAEWSMSVRARMERLEPPFDSGLVELGATLLESLPTTAKRDVVVHGDFNPGNVLAATREPWLAIDCKPMVGDPGYDPSQFVLQVDSPFQHADPPAVLAYRFDLFADLVGEDPQRLYAWAVAREVEYAMWETERDAPDKGDTAMAQVAVLARLGRL